jgi:hypothetical protein
VPLFRQSEDLIRVGLVAFYTALLDESLVTEMLNVVLSSASGRPCTLAERDLQWERHETCLDR